MQRAGRLYVRNAQQMRNSIIRFTALFGACLWLILPLLVEAGSVSRIYGAASTLPSNIEPLCGAPQICPDFWDFRPTEGSTIIYGNRAYTGVDTSCRKSTDAGRTFNLCPTAYPVTTVQREIDIPSNGSILSMRFEGIGSNRCLLDKSTDGGNSWTQVTIVAGANLQCADKDVTNRMPGETMRCIGSICLAYVRLNTTGRLDIYRSTDNGDTWALVSTGNVPLNCLIGQHIFFDGTVGLASCHRNLTGATEGARVSIDAGATWSYITPPANLDYCGTGSAISGFGTSYGFVCVNSAFTSFRLMDSTGAALTPSSQTATVMSPFTNPSTIQLDSNDIWMFMNLHVFKITNGGQDIYEIPESIDGSFQPDRLYQGRSYQGALLISTGSGKFFLLQGH